MSALGSSPAEVEAAVTYLKGVDLPLEELLRRALTFLAEQARR
ncbi:MAG: hypothetical protein ACRDF8_07375 [Chloroflexota bacterium]